MLKPKVLEAMNAQIKKEFESAYIYLGMAAYFEGTNLPGFAHWMHIQFEEELDHTYKFFDFINDRGEKVILEAINRPPSSYDSPLDAFKSALKHEQYITGSINDLYALAEQEKDYASKQFLHWFIEEQVEEEQNAGEVVDTLTMMGDNYHGILMLDRELGQRQPPPEAADGGEEANG